MEPDNKYIASEDVGYHTCPFRSSSDERSVFCGGPECMAWKWTKYKIKTELMAIKSDYNQRFHSEDVETEIPTHGCCGMVYSEKEIKLKKE